MSSEKSSIVSLDNNLDLQLLSIPSGKTALFAVSYFAGSMYEKGFGSGSNDGISHFLEHMFFKGTPTRTTKQVNDEFTRLGADLNAYTTYDHTVYFAKVPTRNLRKTAEIWKELLIDKSIDPTEFDAEKKVVLQEIQFYADMPEMDTLYRARKKQFHGTPLEHSILGTPDSVGNITLTMMTDYISQHYSLDNAGVVLVGGFDLEAEKQFLTSLFNEPISNPRKKPSYPPRFDFSSQKNRISYFQLEKPKPLSYVVLGWNIPGTASSDFFPLLFLSTFIGNSRTSLLYREITSKGLASVCRVGLEPLFDVSASNISFVTQPNKTKEVFDKIIDLLIHISEMTITPEITIALKEEILGSYFSEIEDPANYGIDLLQKYVKFREWVSMEEFQNKIINVTPERIQEAKDRSLEHLDLTVYATGTIPENWKPQFPKHSPW
ncbi:MAG: M16 family metallopeptidase [Candidatus Hodarchaeales archaeon]|jgi:predicted Zn-dependent peptidase